MLSQYEAAISRGHFWYLPPVRPCGLACLARNCYCQSCVLLRRKSPQLQSTWLVLKNKQVTSESRERPIAADTKAKSRDPEFKRHFAKQHSKMIPRIQSASPCQAFGKCENEMFAFFKLVGRERVELTVNVRYYKIGGPHLMTRLFHSSTSHWCNTTCIQEELYFRQWIWTFQGLRACNAVVCQDAGQHSKPQLPPVGSRKHSYPQHPVQLGPDAGNVVVHFSLTVFHIKTHGLTIM